MKAKSEPDWKAIAMQLVQRVNFAVTYLKAPGAGFMTQGGLSAKRLKLVHWKDYMADGMEMIPSVRVDRKVMHMTDAERRKAAKEKAKGVKT